MNARPLLSLASLATLGALASLTPFVSLACATAPAPARVWSEQSDPALLYSGQQFELRIRGGRVEQLFLPTDPSTGQRVRVIDDLEELRRVYQAAGQPLVVSEPERTIEVVGWVGLQCARAGEACGPMPADLPGVMIVLRFE